MKLFTKQQLGRLFLCTIKSKCYLSKCLMEVARYSELKFVYLSQWGLPSIMFDCSDICMCLKIIF